eukprot:TRINITY_DN5738_c0_g1_i2.p1 TRINITY_DN5738_c0_g1~~TRINITY_DN5738_c0_g1_i2.p1  ORF type:complete len:1299 (+),score=380.62 TRINITY_DN5738_c0_g1_i2:88-3897(+)
MAGMGGRDQMNKNLKYVKQNNIAVLLNDMVVHLLAQRPNEPLDALIAFLHVKARDPEVRETAATASAAASAAPAAAAAAEAAAPAADEERSAAVAGTEEAAPAAETAAAAPCAVETQPAAAATPPRPATRQRLPPPAVHEEVLEPVRSAGEPAWEREEVDHAALSKAVRRHPRHAEVDVADGDETLLGRRGFVSLHHDEEGEQPVRVTIRFPDGDEVTAVPAGAVRTIAPADQHFPLGTRVQFVDPSAMDGAEGTVHNHARGRVGVLLEDGSVVGALPQYLRVAQLTPQQELPVGTPVMLLDAGAHSGGTGVVASHHRGRCGVRMDHNKAEVHGRPVGSLRKVPRSAMQQFPLHSTVEVVASGDAGLDGLVGRVKGHGRGRVGVTFEDGRKAGLLPEALRQVAKTAAQKFLVGSRAVVVCPGHAQIGGIGEVKNVYRGRVGLEFQDGTTKGFIAEHLSPVDPMPKVGEDVAVMDPAGHGLAGRIGRVAALNRGRVGVEFNDGSLAGFPASQVDRIAPEPPRQFPVGTAVSYKGDDDTLVGRTGRVAGHCRGRVGVLLEDGRHVGVPPQHLETVKRTGPQLFPLGTRVSITSDNAWARENGLSGQVIGHSRDRVGVELADGTRVGVPCTCITKEKMPISQEFSLGKAVAVVQAASKFAGLAGRVTGTSRGRVGVELPDGNVIGVPATDLAPDNATATISLGTAVTVALATSKFAGLVGNVVGNSRGRVGVEFEDGRTVGLPSSDLKVEKPKRQFDLGAAVTVVNAAGRFAGLSGKVIGNGRGRVGVQLDDGTKVGLPTDQVVAETKSAAQAFGLGTAVTVALAAGKFAGLSGKVTGTSRGRVGIELDDGRKVGLPADQIVAEKKNAAQGFGLGTAVTVALASGKFAGLRGKVTGTSRGRVGVELEDGTTVGLPADQVVEETKSAAQAFGLGTAVTVALAAGKFAGLSGTVVGTSRGRVGVELDDGRKVGLPADQVEAKTKSAVQAFSLGTAVTVALAAGKFAGLSGTVIGAKRGRVGVELADGRKVGLPAGLLQAEGKSAAQKFTLGTAVTVALAAGKFAGLSGKVVGAKRGRVGVKLDGEEGTVVGLPADQVVVAPEKPSFDLGAAVAVAAASSRFAGLIGKVTGTARGRVGVEFDEGKTVGLPAGDLRAVPPPLADAFPKGGAVEIVMPGSPHDGAFGVVVGHARGRVGVKIDDTAATIGLPREHVRPKEKDYKEEFPIGASVAISRAGETGEVSGHARGRVAVTAAGGVRSFPTGVLKAFMKLAAAA